MVAMLAMLSIGLVAWPGKKQKDEPIFKNLTQSLTIVGYEHAGAFDAEPWDQSWRLHLRNDNPVRAVTAYTIHIGGGTVLLADGRTGYGGWSVPPKGTFDFDAQVKGPHQEITIIAIAFDDGSTEGDYHHARGILDRRIGYERGLKRIIALLKAAASRESDVNTVRNTLADLAKSLTNGEVEVGQGNAISQTMHALDPIADWDREGGQGKRRFINMKEEFSSPHEAVASLLKQTQLRLEQFQEGGAK
jgi:hypothetical protein